MITGTVVLNLTRANYDADSRALRMMYAVPSGCRVILNVGSRSYPDLRLTKLLLEYANKVHFDIHGEPEAVSTWVMTLRGEDPLDVARWSA